MCLYISGVSKVSHLGWSSQSALIWSWMAPVAKAVKCFFGVFVGVKSVKFRGFGGFWVQWFWIHLWSRNQHKNLISVSMNVMRHSIECDPNKSNERMSNWAADQPPASCDSKQHVNSTVTLFPALTMYFIYVIYYAGKGWNKILKNKYLKKKTSMRSISQHVLLMLPQQCFFECTNHLKLLSFYRVHIHIQHNDTTTTTHAILLFSSSPSHTVLQVSLQLLSFLLIITFTQGLCLSPTWSYTTEEGERKLLGHLTPSDRTSK